MRKWSSLDSIRGTSKFSVTYTLAAGSKRYRNSSFRSFWTTMVTNITKFLLLYLCLRMKTAPLEGILYHRDSFQPRRDKALSMKLMLTDWWMRNLSQGWKGLAAVADPAFLNSAASLMRGMLASGQKRASTRWSLIQTNARYSLSLTWWWLGLKSCRYLRKSLAIFPCLKLGNCNKLTNRASMETQNQACNLYLQTFSRNNLKFLNVKAISLEEIHACGLSASLLNSFHLLYLLAAVASQTN